MCYESSAKAHVGNMKYLFHFIKLIKFTSNLLYYIITELYIVCRT
jgi:hypothetical protein